MATIPTFSQVMDSYFLSTWTAIRPDAIDNVLLGTPVYAKLKMDGCFTAQNGGYQAERTIRYAAQTPVAVAKGDVLPNGEVESETAAYFNFRNSAGYVQRSIFDDRANRGPEKIKDYAKTRQRDAIDGLKQQYEIDLFGPFDDGTSATRAKSIQSLIDMIPTNANKASGTYGGIARSNSFWQPKYYQLSGDPNITLLTDMKHIYNTVSANQEAPNLIVTTQTLYEAYEEFALDASQIVKNSTGGKTATLADLGFESLYFKGKELIWTPNSPSGDMRFLNTNYIEVVYDPGMWFMMTDFKSLPNSDARVAQILCSMMMFTTQPRRHGLLYT